mgnify:CR=1 FL=1
MARVKRSRPNYLVKLAMLLAGLVSGISDGELGRQIATREYVSLPASLACVRAYYTLDSEDITR